VRADRALERLEQKTWRSADDRGGRLSEPGGMAFLITTIVDRIRALPILPSPAKPAIPAGLPATALAAGAPVTRSASSAGWISERAWRRGATALGATALLNSLFAVPFLPFSVLAMIAP